MSKVDWFAVVVLIGLLFAAVDSIMSAIVAYEPYEPAAHERPMTRPEICRPLMRPDGGEGVNRAWARCMGVDLK